MRFRPRYTLKRFQRWRVLKTNRFEDTPLFVSKDENGGFQNGDKQLKSVIYCPFHTVSFSGGLVWMEVESVLKSCVFEWKRRKVDR